VVTVAFTDHFAKLNALSMADVADLSPSQLRQLNATSLANVAYVALNARDVAHRELYAKQLAILTRVLINWTAEDCISQAEKAVFTRCDSIS
jgi:hypothetical protein